MWITFNLLIKLVLVLPTKPITLKYQDELFGLTFLQIFCGSHSEMCLLACCSGWGLVVGLRPAHWLEGQNCLLFYHQLMVVCDLFSYHLLLDPYFSPFCWLASFGHRAYQLEGHGQFWGLLAGVWGSGFHRGGEDVYHLPWLFHSLLKFHGCGTRGS